MPDERSFDQALKGLKIDRSTPVEKRRPKAAAAWIVCGIALVGAVAAWRIAAAMLAPVAVETFRVVTPRRGASGDATVLQAAGYVIPHHRIEVASKVVGRVRWMGVDKGDLVTSGDVIVQLETDEYEARLAESLGSLQAAEARLAELEAGSRPEEIERAEADWMEAQAQLKQAETDYRRASELHEQALIATSEFDEVRFRRQGLASRVESLARTLKLLKLGPRQENIDTARAEVQRAQGSVAYSQTLVDATVIRAPVSGTVLERNVEVGELVTTGFVGERGAKGYVVAMADLSDIQVELDISQDDFARIFMHQRAVIATDAYRDRDYSGAVVEISPEADRQKATVQVKVQILEPDHLVRPEMNANVAFLAPAAGEGGGEGGAASARVRIPAAALVGGNSVFLYVDGKAVRRPVRVARTTAAGVEIEEGLTGGEDLILSPPDDLEDQDNVQRENGA
ncbi:MAG: efflux RND transporter periplasmic adaptor subunit [Bryobacterales bacterium]|nr:efflux RND transporter periplasmic adaptor subunit [Bryobacterales bacterium]